MIKAEKLACKSEYRCSRALDEVSFSVDKGELFCVLGASGAGKTCLVHAIGGFAPVESGELHVSRIDMKNREQLWDVRKKCALIFSGAEDMYISNCVSTELTFAARNFDINPEEYESRVSKALSAVGLDGCENASLPLLSAFDRYLLSIAAALVYEPDIIVFDSVADGFEEAKRKKVFEIIRTLHESGLTLIYTSRNTQDAAYAERVLLLKEGHSIGCHSPRRLFMDFRLVEDAGLELPFTARVYRDLLEAGAKLDKCPLDIDELVEEICR